MEAACRGAKSAGGLTVGILPDMDRNECNPYVDFSIVTGLGSVRNSLVVLTGQAVIAVGGAYGTLSEIAFAGIYGRKVIGLGTWRLGPPAPLGTAITEASSAEQAVSLAFEAAVELNAES
jgi:hypothetical protein